MSAGNERERTTGGVLGRAVGKAKEVLGRATENNELAREGRLQQAQSDAEREAARAQREAREEAERAELVKRGVEAERERRELENEVAGQQREQQAERDRLEAEAHANRQADAERQAADARLEKEREGAGRSVEAAEHSRVSATEEAIRLEREAREAEHRAEQLDPKETR